MKKQYIIPTTKISITEFMDDAMQVVASQQGIGYGGEDPGDGTIDPEAPERPEDRTGFGNLW